MKNQTNSFFSVLFGDAFPGVLPVWVKQTKVTKFYQCTQLDQLSSYAKSEAQTGDLYFGLGLLEKSPSSVRGKSQDIIALPGFWFDLEVKSAVHPSSDYPPDRETARRILQEFSLLPTVIVDSGYGLQLYWLFDELWIFKDESDRREAKIISKRFRTAIMQLFQSHGYKVDNTADIARVLRIPGTLNHKTESPASVKIVNIKKESERRYSLDTIMNAIENSITTAARKPKPRIRRQRSKYPECDAEGILRKCNWFNHCQYDSMTLSEPLWFAMLTIVARCKDPILNAHRLSEGYPDYDRRETQDKIERIVQSHSHPISCSYIKTTFNSGFCDNCTHTVKSPIALGQDTSNTSLEKIGFVLDDSGKILSLNGNKFARYLLHRYHLLFTAGDRFYEYNSGVWNYLEGNQLSRQLRDVLHEFAPDYWSPRTESLYIEALKREAPFCNDLNQNREMLNLANGMLDLQTFELKPHDPSYRSSIQLPIDYDEEAQCPQFDQFLSDVFNKNGRIIRVIEEIMGYCLTAETSAQKAFLFYGQGSNGKSLLTELIMALCGQRNTSAVALGDLENAFDRYQLVGKLLNVATENEVSSNGLVTAAFKSIVSGDPIQVEQKYEPSFLVQPFCKMIFSLNNLPFSRDKSNGFLRRLLIIPFEQTFRESDPNTRVYSELRMLIRAELAGILNRALRGLKRLRENNYRFSESKRINAIHNQYRQVLNPYAQFVAEMIVQGCKNDKILNDAMHKAFEGWCRKNGHDQIARGGHLKRLIELRKALNDAQILYVCGKSGGKRLTGTIKCNPEGYKELMSGSDIPLRLP